jgi:hypothetical protein
LDVLRPHDTRAITEEGDASSETAPRRPISHLFPPSRKLVFKRYTEADDRDRQSSGVVKETYGG